MSPPAEQVGSIATCYRAEDGSRRISGRHLGGCVEPALCRGCAGCDRAHCDRCGQRHVEAAVVCEGCLALCRADLDVVAELYRHLLDEALRGSQAVRELPGGDATVAMSPWSAGLGSILDEHWQQWRDYTDANAYASDWHPVLTLDLWCQMWREWTGLPEPATRWATMDRCVGYLRDVLGDINTAQPAGDIWPPEYVELAADVAATRTRLENVLRDGERRQSGAPCLRCNTSLLRVVDDDGALSDDWTCPHCRRDYDEVQYANAVAAGYAVVQVEVVLDGLGGRETWGTVARAAIETRRSERTIRTWLREGLIRRACLTAGRRSVISVDDARRQNADRARRYRSAAKSA